MYNLRFTSERVCRGRSVSLRLITFPARAERHAPPCPLFPQTHRRWCGRSVARRRAHDASGTHDFANQHPQSAGAQTPFRFLIIKHQPRLITFPARAERRAPPSRLFIEVNRREFCAQRLAGNPVVQGMRVLPLLGAIGLLLLVGCASQNKSASTGQWCKWCRYHRMAVCAKDVMLPPPPDLKSRLNEMGEVCPTYGVSLTDQMREPPGASYPWGFPTSFSRGFRNR